MNAGTRIDGNRIEATLGDRISTAQTIEQCRKTLAVNPDYHYASLYKGWAHAQLRDYQQAVAELLKTRTLPGGRAAATAELGYVYAISGQGPLARKMLRELEALVSREHIDPYYVALVHLGLGRLDDTFTWLDKAFEDRSFWLVSLNVEPKFDRVRQDPRFTALRRRLGLRESRTAGLIDGPMVRPSSAPSFE